MPSEDTTFKPGKSGNPGGRPKSTLSTTLRNLLLKKAPKLRMTNEQAVCRKIISLALDGDRDMITLIFERLEGKAVQPIEGNITETKRMVLIFPPEAGK